MVVLDASVIIKWLFEEEGSINAISWRDRHLKGEETVVAPELLYYEIANVLATKTLIDKNSAILGFNDIFNFELEIYDLGIREFQNAIEIAKKHKISLYDSSYIALAVSLNCDFVTADRKLFEKISYNKFVKFI